MNWDIAVARKFSHAGRTFDIDLKFRTGASRVVLAGPSGAGKSLSLRLISGLLAPERGRIVLAGRTLFDSASDTDLNPRERRVGHVFQDFALFPHLTVRGNIAFALKDGWTNPRSGFRDPRVEEHLTRFGLEAVADHLPERISIGQKQRVAIARALVASPAALLLDEPFASLDAPLRRRLRGELIGLQQTLGIPMLLVTHDEEDVAEFAQTVVRIDAGKIHPPAQADENLR